MLGHNRGLTHATQKASKSTRNKTQKTYNGCSKDYCSSATEFSRHLQLQHHWRRRSDPRLPNHHLSNMQKVKSPRTKTSKWTDGQNFTPNCTPEEAKRVDSDCSPICHLICCNPEACIWLLHKICLPSYRFRRTGGCARFQTERKNNVRACITSETLFKDNVVH